MQEPRLILLMTHGSFCEALLNSTELILGKMENIKAFPLLPGISPEEYTATITKHLEENGKEAYILTDIQGGTPCNVACSLSRKYDLDVFSGLNMAMLISLDELRHQGKDEQNVAKELLLTATNSIQYMEKQ